MIHSDAVQYAIRHDHSALQLTNQGDHWANQMTYGLTTAHAHADTQIQLRTLRVPGGVCARPSVQVTLSYQPVVVDIARDLASGSCQYREILAHELKHVAAFEAHLEATRKTLLAKLGLEPRFGNAKHYRDTGDALATFDEIENQWLNPVAEKLLEDVQSEQQAIDTPAEYARLSSACT